MKVAVADVGTNSSHLLIAESTAGTPSSTVGAYRVIDALKDRTRLGECLDEQGNLTPEGEDRLASALTRFRELAAAAGITEVHVYATSALREAPNGQAVADRMKARTGIYPVIISGQREGELTYLGVTNSVELGDDNVLLDLGGGSLEFVRGEAHRADDILSLPLGSIRMTRAFLTEDPPSRKALDALTRHVQQALQPHAARFQAGRHTRFILSSGTAEAAAAAIRQQQGHPEGSVNGVHFTLSELRDLLEHLRRLKGPQRARLPGMDRRADTVIGGVCVLVAALDMLGATEVTVSEGALREGMLIEELSRLQAYTSGLSARQRSVLATAERFGANLTHSRQVAALARDLLERLNAAGERHPEEARSLLTAAAALHEIGQIVAQSAHHKHSAYLIRHAELRGFSPRDIELIAQMARYHRKSGPKPTHADHMALSPADRALVSRLAAILRVADGLDRSHAGTTRIHSLKPYKQGWQLHTSGATPLDLQGARDKADLWAREYGPIELKG